MAENTVSVELTIEQDQALRSLASLGKGLDDFSKKATQSTNNAGSSFSSFGKTVAAVFSGNIIADFAEKAVESLASIPEVLAKVVEKGAEVEAVNNRLATALAISGTAGEDASKQFQDLAEQISKLTGIDDDAIKSSAAYALTLGATDAQAQKIIKTAADLSVGLGVDFNTAVQQLSSTLEGSSGRLGKVSFAVRQLDEDALKSGAAIDILSKQFAGLAEANSGNLDVQFRNVSIAIDDIVKSFGTAITGSDQFKALFVTINEGLQQFGDFVKANKPAITDLTGSLVDGFVKGAEAVAAFVDASVRLGAVIKNVFEIGLGTIATGLNSVDVAISSTADAITGLFGGKVDTSETEAAFTRLNESIAGTVQDSADLQKALAPEAFVPGVQAIFNLGNAYEQNAAKIKDTAAATEAANEQLAEQGAARRAAEQQKRLDQEVAFREQLNEIGNQAELTREEGEAQLSQNSLILRTNEYQNIQQLEQDKVKAQFDGQAARLALLKDGTEKERAVKLNDANRDKALSDLRVKQELENQQRRNKGINDALSETATLMSSSNSELFAIGKAAAIAQATISGIQAVQNALADVPYPFNFIAAATVGIASAVNIANIVSQQPPAFATGGVVGGTSFTGDNVTARVNSGEMILNSQQQATLFNIANGGGGASGGGVVSAINALGDRIAAMQTQININGREIARVVRDEVQGGFAL